MGTRKVTPLGQRPQGGRAQTGAREGARRHGVPSTPAELARAVERFSPEQVASIGAALLIADRIERVELALARVLDVLLKHAGSDKPVASAESVQAVAAALDHLSRRVAACEVHSKSAPGLSFGAGRRSKKETQGEPADGGGDGTR